MIIRRFPAASRAVCPNLLPNPYLVGGVAGSPGTMPPNTYTDTDAGLTRTITLNTDPSGLPSIDINFTGTAVGTAMAITFAPQNTLVKAWPAAFNWSLYVSLVGGSLTNITTPGQITVNALQANSTFISQPIASNFTPNATLTRISATATMPALTAIAQVYFNFQFAASAVINVTYRFAAPWWEQGSAATPFGASWVVPGVRLPGGGTRKAILPRPATDSSGGVQSLLPDVGSIAFTGLAPGVDTALLPGVGSVIFTGLAPSANEAVLPGAGSIVFTGQVPTVAVGTTVAPGAGSVVFTGKVPSADEALLPGVGSVVFTGQAPSVNETVLPGVGSVVFTGLAPTVAVGTTVAPGAGSIAFAGQAPSVNEAVLPGVGSILFTGQAPGVSNPAAGQNLLPDAGAVVFTGRTPSVDLALLPGVGAIIFTGAAPSLDQSFFPAPGSVLFGGFAPDITGFGSATPAQTGPGDGIWDADEQRRRWVEWSLLRNKGKKKPRAEQPAPLVVRPVLPDEPAPPAAVVPPVSLDTLLAANAAAVRAQQQSDAVTAAVVARLRKARDDDDDDDAISILFDD